MNRPCTVDDKSGYATLPEGPGLGVRIDVQKLAQVAADPKYKWTWPKLTLPDGSVTDYRSSARRGSIGDRTDRGETARMQRRGWNVERRGSMLLTARA